ncbi:MAG TPA: sulfite exporter TauE/SafE family protein [Gemmatimonadales bacterium]
MYLLGAAFLTGLLGSVHCVAMCGAFAASCTRVPRGLPAWHAGRIGTYALLGALAGAAGRLLPGPPWVPAVVAAGLLLWFALALAGLVPEPRLIPRGLTSAAGRAAGTPSPAAQAAFGVANGFLPCGLVYSALSIPVALADPARGALAMIAFGAGTLPALSVAALGLRRLVMTSMWRRRMLAVLVLATGAWAIWTRAAGTGAAGHHHAPASPAAPQNPD